jgi:hypothetical protein
MKSKAYTFIPSQENLIRFSKLSARQKLEWLAEANGFINKFVSGKKRKAWERFIQYSNQQVRETRTHKKASKGPSKE